jgi:GT2 family glycosyltransferase
MEGGVNPVSTCADPTRINTELKSAADLSVLIVNWKSKDFLRKCLISLRSAYVAIPMEIIVVDGGSFDGCGEMLAKEFPEVKFVQARENLGFGRSNNLGAQSVSSEMVLLLNPDTEVEPTAIHQLLKSFQELPAAGILGARLLNTDGSLQTSCVQSFPTPLNQALDANLLRKRFPHSSLWGIAALENESAPSEVEAISGACMLMKTSVFRDVGGFSPEYFMYGEDMDLCRKVNRKGLRVYYVPAARIVHHEGGRTQATNFSTVMSRESVWRFIRRHSGPVSALAFRALLMIAALVRIVVLAPLASLPVVSARAARASMLKWVALLRWSIGLEKWVRQYGVTTDSAGV